MQLLLCLPLADANKARPKKMQEGRLRVSCDMMPASQAVALDARLNPQGGLSNLTGRGAVGTGIKLGTGGIMTWQVCSTNTIFKLAQLTNVKGHAPPLTCFNLQQVT